jgi:hypothetical protein
VSLARSQQTVMAQTLLFLPRDTVMFQWQFLPRLPSA